MTGQSEKAKRGSESEAVGSSKEGPWTVPVMRSSDGDAAKSVLDLPGISDLDPVDRRITESFVRGWIAQPDDNSATFDAGLNRLLAAIRGNARAPIEVSPTSESAPTMIQSELWQVLQRIRESGELFYARESDINELDRRVIFVLHANGPLTALDICGAMGVDKAQVSRTVKRLIEADLLERAQLRAPLDLTAHGRDVAWRLARLAELRNRELTLGVSDDELNHLFKIIDLLLDRSVALYEIERDSANAGSFSQDGLVDTAAIYAMADDRRPSEKLLIDRSRIISPLLTLSAYFSRSGALAYRRLANLSAFEAFVMSEIGRNAPISWSDLVHELQRDQSQAGRTITALIERGLVVRNGKSGRRNGLFDHTEKGKAIYRIIVEVAAQRSAYLMGPLSADQRSQFLTTFATIRQNADRQLERERAFAETSRRDHMLDRPA